MRQILTGGDIFRKDGFLRRDLVIENGIVAGIGDADDSVIRFEAIVIDYVFRIAFHFLQKS